MKRNIKTHMTCITTQNGSKPQTPLPLNTLFGLRVSNLCSLPDQINGQNKGMKQRMKTVQKTGVRLVQGKPTP
jgi:hypothetical protein